MALSRWKQKPHRLISWWLLLIISIIYCYLMLPTYYLNNQIIATTTVFAFMATTTTSTTINKRRRHTSLLLVPSSLQRNCGCYYISRSSVPSSSSTTSTSTSSSTSCTLLLSSKKKSDEDMNFSRSSISPPVSQHLRPPPVAPREEDRYFKIDYYHKKKTNHDSSIDIDSSSTTSKEEEIIYQEEEEEEATTMMIPNPYGWMRDDTRTSTKVLDYIHEENEYTTTFQYAKHHNNNKQSSLLQLQTDLTNEFQQFTPIKNDISQVYEMDEYYYFIKRIPDRGPYPLHCRWRYNNIKRSQSQKQQQDAQPLLHTADDDYQVILDENEIAAQLFRRRNNNNSCSSSSSNDNNNINNNNYFAIHSVVPSPSHRFLAYSVDITGNETYDIFIRDLNLKEEEEDQNNNNKNNDDDYDDIKIASNVAGNFVWGLTDDDGLYFVGIDQQLFRPYQLYQWKKNESFSSTTSAAATTATTSTILLKEEERPNISCELYKSMDRQYLFWITRMQSDNHNGVTTTSSTNVSALDLSTNQFIEISWSCPKKSILMKIEHRDSFWWALSTEEEEDGEGVVILSTISSTSTVHHGDDEDWTKIDWDYDDLDHHPSSVSSASINDMHIFQNHIILQGRGQDGLAQIWCLKLDDDEKHDNSQEGKKTISTTRIKHVEKVDFEESARYCSVGRYQEYNSDAVTITYESMVSPPQTLRLNLNHPNSNDNNDTGYYGDVVGGKKRIEVLQQTEIPGYSKENYECHRLEIVSRDGQTKIPVSIVYHRRNKKTSIKKRRPGRLHLLGYGSYGHSLEPAFSALKVPLLNRGVICAIAHVRGGGELGHNWYKEGSGLKKKNSINDFIDVARWLCGDGNDSSSTSWTKPNLLSCEGRSAGGLLVAAAVNEDPTLFRSVFLGVAFLDVLATMSDPTLPLTSLEYDEWGNPHQLEGLRSIQDYCPIQNIKSNTVYPSFWIAASLHDPRTPYWESLKYAATLRHKTKNWNNIINNRPICVKVDTNAGHSLGSNRTRFFEEMGCIYAFLLSQFDDEEDTF